MVFCIDGALKLFFILFGCRTNGTFTLTIDLFKKGGGGRESQRLGVPLLGKIPLSQTIMDSTDAGNPIAFGSPDNPYSKIFSNIVLQIAKDLGH